MNAYVCVECGGKLEVETSVAFADGPKHHPRDCDYSPFEYHSMPNGTKVFYRDSDHSYYSEIQRKSGKWTGVKSARLPSPSQIAKFADPNPDKRMDWAARKNLEGVVLLGKQYESAQELADALTEKKLSWRHLRDQAGDVGTITHDAFEKGLHGTPVPLEGANEAEQGHLIALDRFFNEHEWEVRETEQVVYSAEYGFAGRYDGALVLTACDGGCLACRELLDKESLGDLKTGYIGKAAHLQLPGYRLGRRESGFGHAEAMFLLDTRSDGTYQIWPVRGTEDGFLHALSLYREAKALDAACRADWKAAA